MTDMGPHFNQLQEKALTWTILLVLVVGFIALVGLWLALVFFSFEEVRQELVSQHFVAIVGMPAAFVAAFMLVFLFRQTSGPVEFEVFTIKFKGAAGPVILWILCFLAMAGAMKMLW